MYIRRQHISKRITFFYMKPAACCHSLCSLKCRVAKFMQFCFVFSVTYFFVCFCLYMDVSLSFSLSFR